MRRRARLVWRLFSLFTVIVCGTLVAAGWYFSQAFDAFFQNEVAVDLTARNRIMQALIAPRLSPLDAATVDDLCKRLGAESNTRYTVLLPSGAVVGDTWETPANMDNHAARPEVAGALARGTESSRRTTIRRLACSTGGVATAQASTRPLTPASGFLSADRMTAFAVPSVDLPASR